MKNKKEKKKKEKFTFEDFDKALAFSMLICVISSMLAFCAIIFSLVFHVITADAKELPASAHIHRAVFTGYYPEDSAMEGGFQAYNGEWLDPSEYTVAAPKCIPIGSKITVGGTGNWRDGCEYRVNDRGGAIIVDNEGIYHIDILMSCREQANRFGRVYGYIIVEE